LKSVIEFRCCGSGAFALKGHQPQLDSRISSSEVADDPTNPEIALKGFEQASGHEFTLRNNNVAESDVVFPD